MNEEFFEWLDGEILCVDKGAVAYSVNVYQLKNGFSAGLIGAASFDDEDDDWVHDTLYSSRGDGDEFKFTAENRKKALEFVRTQLKEYLMRGARAKQLKSSRAVACSLYGGDLHLLYRR
ncbi:MAG: hypothetical protein K2I30_04710 [Clostridia bacterium]|nr:hypothetical protein [Clostridia bacterium]